MMKRLDSPWVNLLITAFVYGLYLFLLLSRLEYNPSYLISLGEKFADLNKIPKKIVVWKNYGYDGQFYYRLALNPFTSKKEEYGITLDAPSYRHQRIIYPLLTWLVSFGQKEIVPKLLILNNFIALLALGLLGGYFARSFKLHSFWGLVFVMHPGFPYTLSHNLTEILQASFLLAGLLFTKTHRYIAAATFLTLAILTRETALIVAVSCLLIIRSRYFVFPIAAYILWQVLLFLNWGQTPILLANLSLGTPLLGISSYLRSALNLATYAQKIGFIQILFLAIFTAAVFNAFKSSKALFAIKIAFLMYFVLALFYTSYIWVADIAFFRALTEFYIFGAAILVSSRSKVVPYILLLVAVIWLLSIKHFGYF